MTGQTTSFNGALAHLERLHIIEQNLIFDIKTMNLEQWLYDLHNFYMQIMTVMSKEDEKELYKEYETLASNINEHLLTTSNPRNLRRSGINPTLINKLDNFHRKLLRIYHDSGLQMKLETAAEAALR